MARDRSQDIAAARRRRREEGLRPLEVWLSEDEIQRLDEVKSRHELGSRNAVISMIVRQHQPAANTGAASSEK